MKRRATWLLVLTLALVAAGCGDDDDTETTATTEAPTGTTEPAADKGSITVGSKLDTEAQLLGQMLAQTLEAKGYEVTTKIPTGNTDITRKALESGEIDIYWEFTSSGLSILGETPIGDPQEAFEKVKELDEANGITWLPSAEMNDTYALAVASGSAVDVRTLSELATYVQGKPDTKLCVDPEGGFREDVLPLVEREYGLKFTNTQQVGYELIPPAVKDGQCEVGIVYSTAALIVKNDLQVLDDDKKVFGAYTPAPTIKSDTLEAFPDLEDDLAELTAALDTPTITDLNAKVDVDKMTAEEVAGQFLGENGLI